MGLYAYIAWQQGTNSSLNRVKTHLSAYKIRKRRALAKLYPEVETEMLQKIFMAPNAVHPKEFRVLSS